MIPANTRFRLTFGERYSINPDSLFARYMPDVYNKLGPVAHLLPATALGVTSGDIVTVVEAMNLNERRAGDMLAQLGTLENNFVEVTSVEQLTPAQKAVANTPAGAAERDQATKDATDAANANSFLGKLLAQLAALGTFAKWSAVAVVVLLILYYMPKRGGHE